MIFARLHALAEPVFRCIAEQVADSSAYEAITLVRIDHENQIREAFQQVTLKFLLAAQRSLHFSPLSDVDQRALITDDLSTRIPDRARSIEKCGERPVLSAECYFTGAHSSLIVGASA